jgi:hypothetical protein
MVTANRERRAEYYRAYDRVRSKTPGRVAHITQNTRRWRRSHPERAAAHAAVSNAIRDGKLTPKPCELCGGKAHANHHDYSKPLDVWWRCARCHSVLHKEECP